MYYFRRMFNITDLILIKINWTIFREKQLVHLNYCVGSIGFKQKIATTKNIEELVLNSLQIQPKNKYRTYKNEAKNINVFYSTFFKHLNFFLFNAINLIFFHTTQTENFHGRERKLFNLIRFSR